MNIEKKKVFLIHIAHLFVVVALFYLTMRFCLDFILPILIGLIVAAIVQKPAEWLSKKLKFNESVLALFCALLIFITVFSAFAFLLFRVYVKLTYISPILPDYIKDIYLKTNDVVSQFKIVTERISKSLSATLFSSFDSLLQTLLTKIADIISSASFNFAKALPKFLFGTLVAIITGCYTAKDFKKLKKFLKEALPKKYIESLVLLRKITTKNTFGIMKGYLILAALAFAELFVLFLVFGIENAFKRAIIISVVDMLPVLGAGVVLLPWAIVAAFGNNFSLCIKLLVIYVIVVLLRNTLESKIIGKQIDIHPVITLFAIFVGLKLFGVAGMLVFPLIITVLFNFLKEKYLQKYQKAL